MTTTQAQEAAAMFDPTTLVAYPEENFSGTGPTFEIIVRKDILTHHGNIVVKAGRYEAKQSTDAPEGVVSIWSPMHYTGNGGMWCSISATDWTFPGEAQRPIPEHDCGDHARSGVVSGVYCSMCMAVLA